MLSRPQVSRRRPVPCAVVLCAGLLAGALLPGTAHAAGGHGQIISQIIGGSRDHRGSTVGAGNHRQIIGGRRDYHGSTVSPMPATAAAPGVRNAG
jgi:hypothetical protein